MTSSHDALAVGISAATTRAMRGNAWLLAALCTAQGALVWTAGPADLALAWLPLPLLALPLMHFTRLHVRAGNFVIAGHVIVVLLFALFAHMALAGMPRLVPEPAFDFSALTFSRLRRVAALSYLVLAVGMLVIALQPRLSQPNRNLSPAPLQSALGVHLSEGMTIAIALGVTLVSFGTVLIAPTVLEFPYPLHARQPGSPPAMWFNVLLSLAAMVLVSATIKAGSAPAPATLVLTRLCFYLVVTATLIVAGGRGGAVSILFVVIFIDYLRMRRTRAPGTLLVLLFDVALVLFLLVHWPEIRGHIHADGLAAIAESLARWFDGSRPGPGGDGRLRLGEFPMLGQSLFHWLYTATLVDIGQSRALATFYNLVPQALPQLFDGVLWQRPLPDAELLRRWFHHGGGLFIYANAHWNGGPPVVLGFALVGFFVFARIDILFKTRPAVYLFSYLIFLILIPVTSFYGIQALVRALQFGAIAYVAVALIFGRAAQRP